MRRVQNQGRAKFLQKTLCPGKKVPKSLITGQVFTNLRVPKLEYFTFQQVGHFFHSFIKYDTFFVKNCQKPNTWAKFTFQNLMPGQNLTPAKPNAQARTSIPTFTGESPPSSLNLVSFRDQNVVDEKFTGIF